MVIRYALISAHYRQQLNFTKNGLHAAQSALQKMEKSVARLLAITGQQEQDFDKLPMDFSALEEGGFSVSWKALEEDLNVPEATGAMFSRLKETDHAGLSREQAGLALRELRALLYALGLKLFTEKPKETEAPADIKELAEQRWKVKTEKDWAQADALREQVKAQGWSIKDTRDGYELEAL
jgi:cysteinyl-tRNA synthetase